MGMTAASSDRGLAQLASNLKLSEGQRNIALIQYAIETLAAHFTAYDAEDINWLKRILNSIRFPESSPTFSELITEYDIKTYISFRGVPLPGLNQVYDGGGAPTWQECEPTSTIQQTWYIQHELLPRLAQVTIETIATLTPDKAEEMKVSAVRALPELVDTLVALDIQNEDESLSFGQRPNAHRDLFGDICRDVLKQRVTTVLQQINSP